MDIAIIGGGLGGLATALRLHQQGFKPRVYEASTELKVLGNGIGIQPYATREIAELGLLDEFLAESVDASESLYLNRFGQQIFAEKRGSIMGYEYPERLAHRAVLQRIFLDAVVSRLGPDAVVLGARCTGVEQDKDSVTVRFDQRLPSAPAEIRADVVIGADGVKSAVRRSLYPDRSDPKFSGIVLWRGTTLMPPYLNGTTKLHIGAPSTGNLIIYPIMNNAFGTDKTLVNWVIEDYNHGEVAEDWNQRVDPTPILHMFDEWEADFIDVGKLLRDSRETLIFPLVDHDPLPSWSVGRVTLLGDAAHAMYPRGGNGVCQALVDARVLAAKLGGIDDAQEALKAYDAERREAVYRIVIANRGEGPESIRRIVDERTGGKKFDNIEDVLPYAEANAILSEYHGIVGMSRPTDAPIDKSAPSFFSADHAESVRVGNSN
jgi:2-polyprenyl-6-methoxyphenol hydroxylase-like FAD-dependent oxidoreductase